MNDLNVGIQLKVEIFKRRLRQRDVAARASLSPSAVSDFLNGYRVPRPEQLKALCSAIGVRVEDLETQP